MLLTLRKEGQARGFAPRRILRVLASSPHLVDSLLTVQGSLTFNTADDQHLGDSLESLMPRMLLDPFQAWALEDARSFLDHKSLKPLPSTADSTNSFPSLDVCRRASLMRGTFSDSYLSTRRSN